MDIETDSHRPADTPGKPPVGKHHAAPGDHTTRR
jgi:hypothetical protein